MSVTLFKTKEDYEILQQMNTVQNSIILDLQQKNELLEQKIKHLESLLFSRAVILEVGQNDNT